MSAGRVTRLNAGSLSFDVADDGPLDGPAVIALHGFPEDRQCWAQLTTVLTAAGFRVLAPEQRGYSPGARPQGRRAYTVDHLARDVLALADAAGAERFDLIGHDWGAIVAWDLAGHHPERVRSLTALSVPHAGAVRHALPRSYQLLRSWYVLAFQLPVLPEWAMRVVGADRAARWLERDGLDRATARRYARRIPHRAEMTPRIAWYRGIPLLLGREQPVITVPTLYCWGTGDHFIDRTAAERCGRFVSGAYRFERLVGASHWIPTSAADRVGPALLAHLARARTETTTEDAWTT